MEPLRTLLLGIDYNVIPSSPISCHATSNFYQHAVHDTAYNTPSMASWLEKIDFSITTQNAKSI
jgi:hypothetical protein